MQVQRDMKRIIKTQRMIMYSKKGFRIAFSIMMAGQLLVYISSVLFMKQCDRFLSVTPMAAFSLGIWGGYCSVFTFLMPFLAIFPFAFSYISDVNVKETELILSRVDFRSYYFSKALVSFEGAFYCVLIPLLAGIILNAITFSDGINGIGEAARYSLYEEKLLLGGSGFPFVGFFISHPLLYEAGWSVFCALVCGLIAVFSLSCSLFIRRQQIFLMLPFYVIITLIGQLPFGASEPGAKNYINKSFYEYLSVGYFNGRRYSVFFAFLLLIMVLSFVFLERKTKMVLEEGI